MTYVGTYREELAFNTASSVSSPAAETAILTTDTVVLSSVRTVRISVSMNVTEGTTGTAYVVKLRQGTGTGGTQVGASLTVTLAAAASSQNYFVFEDSSGYGMGGGTYTVTVTQTGATVAGTVNAIEIKVEQ